VLIDIIDVNSIGAIKILLNLSMTKYQIGIVNLSIYSKYVNFKFF